MSLMHGSDSGFPVGDNTATTSASTNPLKVRRTTSHNLMWLCALHKPFPVTATSDHWPWREREVKAGVELLNPELLERHAIFLCSPFFPGRDCCETICWVVWDLSRCETPPWEVSAVSEGSTWTWAAHKEWGRQQQWWRSGGARRKSPPVHGKDQCQWKENKNDLTTTACSMTHRQFQGSCEPVSVPELPALKYYLSFNVAQEY